MERLISLSKEKYSTVLTGAGFMMYEFKQIVSLQLKGYSNEEIRIKVIDENLFQYNKLASLKRSFPYLLTRVDTLDDHLKQMVHTEELRTVKIINLYTIMKTDQLFFEFMSEVIGEKLQHPGDALERKEVNLFFANKAEQSVFIHNLAESTVKRLQSAFLKILLEVDILMDLKARELRRPLIDDQLKEYLIKIGDAVYVKAMGEYEG